MTDQPKGPDYKQLFDDAPCGYVLVDHDGVILKANCWMSTLLGYPNGGFEGRRLRDMLSVAGRILFETNLAPMLRLQGAVSEVTLDLKDSVGRAVPVIMAASANAHSAGGRYETRITFVKASERRLYERELLTARNDAKQDLLREKQDGELREQFVAVLGHDLRNPLASISAAARILSKETLSDRGKQVIGLMQGSAVRMSGLIDNVLDFARARLGGGIGLNIRAEERIELLIDQVVQELRLARPDQQVLTSFAVIGPVYCDYVKIGQLLSNLVGNAMTHGDGQQPIRIHVETTDTGNFRLWVANAGMPISSEAMTRLFDPFVRGEAHGSKDGLGLGLFIAHEIAVAHGGKLTASSTSDETRFTFEMAAVRAL